MLMSALFLSCKDDKPNTPEVTTVTDIDGNVYETVLIGTQTWTVENLKVIHYRNGDAIPIVTVDTDWSNLTSGAYCNYDNDARYVANYGRLYNWHAVNDSRGIAPEGWHVPTDAEWKQMEMCLGMSQSQADLTGWRGTNEGGKIKGTGTDHWTSPNTGATDESGFTCLPAGHRKLDGDYGAAGTDALLWSATGQSDELAWRRNLSYGSAQIYRLASDKEEGYSVRCVKDN